MSVATISHFRLRTKPQLLQETPRDSIHTETNRAIASLKSRYPLRDRNPSPLIRTLDAIESERQRPVVVLIDSESRDWAKWRRGEIEVTGKTCTTCFGKRVVPAYRFAHVDDFIECPICTPLRPHVAIDPTEIDTNDVPF